MGTEVFADYLERIENHQNQTRLKEIFAWVEKNFPSLTPKIAWNQPMFTDHGTFIIGFSVSKNHLAIAPERKGIIYISKEVKQAECEHSQMLVRMRWDSPVNYSLLRKMIEFNIKDKAECKTFWRR